MYLVDGVAHQYFHGPTSVHISYPTVYKDLPLFKAVAGHELLHAFQYYTIHTNPNIKFMEAQAYKYSYEVCFKAGLYREVMKYGKIITKEELWDINVYNKRPNTWGFR